MHTDAARRTYRWVTFGIAFVVSLSVLVPSLALLRFIPLGAAIWLDIHRYHLSLTPAGGAEDLGFRDTKPGQSWVCRSGAGAAVAPARMT